MTTSQTAQMAALLKALASISSNGSIVRLAFAPEAAADQFHDLINEIMNVDGAA